MLLKEKAAAKEVITQGQNLHLNFDEMSETRACINANQPNNVLMGTKN